MFNQQDTNVWLNVVPIVQDTDDLFYHAANTYRVIGSVEAATGARTAYFISDFGLLCVAVPHRGQQRAELRVFKTDSK